MSGMKDKRLLKQILFYRFSGTELLARQNLGLSMSRSGPNALVLLGKDIFL